MKKVSYYLKQHWLAYSFAIICLLGHVSLDMVAPKITQTVIDDVIGKGMVDLLPKLLIALLVVAVGKALCRFLKEFTFDKASFKIAVDVRKQLFDHIQGLSVNFFDNNNTGEIMARLSDDVDRIQGAYGFIGMMVIEITIHTVMILFYMYKISPVLTIFPLIILPICAAIAIVMEIRLDKVYGDLSEENAKMNTVAEENLAGVRVVKAFAREKHEINKFLGHNQKYYDLNMKQSKVWMHFDPYFQLITAILPLVVLLFGGKMVIGKSLTLGALAAFIQYCENVVWPMEMLGWISNEFASAFASKKKLDKIFAEKPVIVEPEKIVGEEKIDGHVRFDNVSLTIGEKDILKDVSFDIPSGKTLGIMGATGAGKTSIVNLLLRFYDPTSGSIKLDDVDLRDRSLKSVRGSVAAVMQDVFLFSDTINENIKMGDKEKVTNDLVNEALKNACADSFVGEFEEKEETIIGERGVGLSGGQKQRLSMARAFSKKEPIIVLDDSTSALDMETEQEIQHNLDALQDVTKIIIAHRISSVRRADEIIVLDNGAVLERGTHETLMEHKGYYYKTYMAQYGEFLGQSEVTA